MSQLREDMEALLEGAREQSQHPGLRVVKRYHGRTSPRDVTSKGKELGSVTPLGNDEWEMEDPRGKALGKVRGYDVALRRLRKLMEGKRRSGAYADVMAQAARYDKRRAAERKVTRRHGVFVWEKANKYDPKDAIKVYKSEKAADKRAAKEPKRNLVVRSFDL